jgi:hypothetical protein
VAPVLYFLGDPVALTDYLLHSDAAHDRA